MKPYYHDEASGITIYHGDCREVVPTLSGIDAVVTDPPYGIAGKWKGGFSTAHGWGRAGQMANKRNEWDTEPPSKETIDLMLSTGSQHIIWGGNYFQLPVSRCWLVWNKPERGFSLAECELAWTDFDNVARVYDCCRSEPDRVHPTQKPLALMSWCINKTDGSILDPFMGSGTTLVAAKLQGRRAIGIEIEERYCEIAAKRLAQNSLFSMGGVA